MWPTMAAASVKFLIKKSLTTIPQICQIAENRTRPSQYLPMTASAALSNHHLSPIVHNLSRLHQSRHRLSHRGLLAVAASIHLLAVDHHVTNFIVQQSTSGNAWWKNTIWSIWPPSDPAVSAPYQFVYIYIYIYIKKKKNST